MKEIYEKLTREGQCRAEINRLIYQFGSWEVLIALVDYHIQATLSGAPRTYADKLGEALNCLAGIKDIA